MNIGTLIRKCRKERKLTLKAVAEKAGISEGFLSRVENAVNSPSVDTLIRIFWSNPDNQKVTNISGTTSFVLWVGTL